MDIEEAKSLCQEFVKAGMLRHHAKNALRREGLAERDVEEAVEDYELLRTEERQRQQRFTRLWAGSLFLICIGAFVYFIGFNSSTHQIYIPWLLAPAAFGLFKFLMP